MGAVNLARDHRRARGRTRRDHQPQPHDDVRRAADLVARARGGLPRQRDRRRRSRRHRVQQRSAVRRRLPGTLGIGAVAVPLNPTSPASELARQIATVGAVAAVVDRTGSAPWRDVDRGSIPSLRTVIAADAAGIPGAVDAAEILAAAPAPVVDVDPDHLAALLFTSGTAGAPRAAMLTHGSMRANLDQARSGRQHVSPGDVAYGVIPLYHVYGLNVVLGQTLLSGATLLLVQRFDPATAIESIRQRERHRVVRCAVDVGAFSQFEEAPADSFATIRLAYSGAAKLPVTVAEAAGATVRARRRRGLRPHRGVASRHVVDRPDATPRLGRRRARRHRPAHRRRRRRRRPRR